MDYQETIRRFPTEAPLKKQTPPGEGGAAKVICLDWRPYQRNTLLGFAQIEVAAWHLIINDVAVHEKDGARWAQLPAKPLLDKATGDIIHEVNGRPRYARVMWFKDRPTANRFSAAVIDAVEQKIGGAI
jgi:hypothetical protein